MAGGAGRASGLREGGAKRGDAELLEMVSASRVDASSDVCLELGEAAAVQGSSPHRYLSITGLE